MVTIVLHACMRAHLLMNVTTCVHARQNSDLAPANTLHVDSFLYSKEEEVDELCSRLNISRNYCLNCGSWKTQPLSMSTL